MSHYKAADSCINTQIITNTCNPNHAGILPFMCTSNSIVHIEIGRQGKNHRTHIQNLLSSKHHNLTKQHQVCLFSVQQIQTHLILFSKSFSYFPHGTCALSVSIIYLPLHETYHPLCIPMPRSVTQQTYTVHRGLHMTKRILTLIDAFFQYANTCTSVGNTFQKHNSKPEAPFIKLSISLFIRNY